MQPELREQLETAASVSGRSLNAEINARLEASFRRTMDDDEVFRIVGQLAQNVRTQKDDAETARGMVIQADSFLDLVLKESTPLPKDDVDKFHHMFKTLADVYRRAAAASKNNVLRNAAGLPELPESEEADAGAKTKKER